MDTLEQGAERGRSASGSTIEMQCVACSRAQIATSILLRQPRRYHARIHKDLFLQPYMNFCQGDSLEPDSSTLGG